MSFQNILVPFDFSEPAGRALKLAGQLAPKLGAKLEVVHVHVDLYDGRSQPQAGIPWPTQEQTERYMRFLHEELHRACQTLLPNQADTISYHVVRGDPVKRIEALAKETDADMICLGSTGKGAVARLLLGSVSQKIVRESSVPVLTVH